MTAHLERRRRRTLATFTMSFGRYRNVPLSKIPRAYLTWLVTEAENVPEGDRWAAEQFLQAGGRRLRNRPR